MKKIYCFLIGLLVAVGLNSCSSEEEEVTSTDTYQLNFQVLNYDIIPIESMTRATVNTNDLHFAMVIYDANTNKLAEEPTIHKPGSANGGTFSARLPKGDYNFVFLAYNSERTLISEDPAAIHWDANVVNNTYLKTIPLSVDENTKAQQDVVLTRAVGLFTLNCKGTPVPQNFDHFRVKMQGGSYLLNAINGKAGSDVTRDYRFLSKAEFAGKTEATQYIYAFLPQEECSVDITMIAEDVNGNPILTRTFTQVPMKINQNTRYTGDFFNKTSNNGFSAKTDEAEWEDVDFSF